MLKIAATCVLEVIVEAFGVAVTKVSVPVTKVSMQTPMTAVSVLETLKKFSESATDEKLLFSPFF